MFTFTEYPHASAQPSTHNHLLQESERIYDLEPFIAPREKSEMVKEKKSYHYHFQFEEELKFSGMTLGTGLTAMCSLNVPLWAY